MTTPGATYRIGIQGQTVGVKDVGKSGRLHTQLLPSESFYDLSGRPITSNLRNNVYLKAGQKVAVR